ncbi:hypothetical protein Ciccas_001880 [Cichlidogyrus casuarinus]|uniref:Uncharacterized protein n=1 Tax=Cichlidogyrus casuarinus TaxID=1844966 RepID=A0ABD2QIT7_9PLAT
MTLGNKSCKLAGRLNGKNFIVTGANCGIGLETAAELARRGAAKVIMACRSEERGRAAKEEILSRYGASNPNALTKNVAISSLQQYLQHVTETQLVVMSLDLENRASIKSFAEAVQKEIPRIDMLINNAGAHFPKSYDSALGNEIHVEVNYLGPFLLTQLLMDKLIESHARIIDVSSMAHKSSPAIDVNRLDLLDERRNGMIKAYSYSKMLNAIHAINLGRKYGDKGIVAVSLHPGVIATQLSRNNNGFFRSLIQCFAPVLKTCWDGAQTTMYCVMLENPKQGGYYSDCALSTVQNCPTDEATLDKIWSWSLEKVGLK